VVNNYLGSIATVFFPFRSFAIVSNSGLLLPKRMLAYTKFYECLFIKVLKLLIPVLGYYAPPSVINIKITFSFSIFSEAIEYASLNAG